MIAHGMATWSGRKLELALAGAPVARRVGRYTPAMADDEILRRLLALNLERSERARER